MVDVSLLDCLDVGVSLTTGSESSDGNITSVIAGGGGGAAAEYNKNKGDDTRSYFL